MATAEQSIDVNVTVTTAYDQWARFESFPRWMEGVASVDQIDDTHLHWVAKVKNEVAEVENETREWDARMSRSATPASPGRASADRPDEKPNAGQVTFEPIGESACRVTFRIDWEPEAALMANEAYVLAAVNQVVAADLARFKELHRGALSRPAHGAVEAGSRTTRSPPLGPSCEAATGSRTGRRSRRPRASPRPPPLDHADGPLPEPVVRHVRGVQAQ